MMRAFFIMLGLAILAVVAYKWAYPSFSCNVRLAVVVDDNGHERSASSVIALSQVANPTFGGFFSDSTLHARGEAVYLDLGKGNNLFVLLGLAGGSPDDIWTITSREFFSDYRAKDYGSLAYSQRILTTNLGKARVLTSPYMPTLVHFRDLADRKSIEAVDPRNAQKTLGPGINIVRVTIELTDALVTSGVIDQRLPWLDALIGKDPMQHLPISGPGPEIGQDFIFSSDLGETSDGYLEARPRHSGDGCEFRTGDES